MAMAWMIIGGRYLCRGDVDQEEDGAMTRTLVTTQLEVVSDPNTGP